MSWAGGIECAKIKRLSSPVGKVSLIFQVRKLRIREVTSLETAEVAFDPRPACFESPSRTTRLCVSPATSPRRWLHWRKRSEPRSPTGSGFGVSQELSPLCKRSSQGLKFHHQSCAGSPIKCDSPFPPLRSTGPSALLRGNPVGKLRLSQLKHFAQGHPVSGPELCSSQG